MLTCALSWVALLALEAGRKPQASARHVHECLRQVAPHLALRDVVLVTEQPGRPAGGGVRWSALAQAASAHRARTAPTTDARSALAASAADSRTRASCESRRPASVNRTPRPPSPAGAHRSPSPGRRAGARPRPAGACRPSTSCLASRRRSDRMDRLRPVEDGEQGEKRQDENEHSEVPPPARPLLERAVPARHAVRRRRRTRRPMPASRRRRGRSAGSPELPARGRGPANRR